MCVRIRVAGERSVSCRLDLLLPGGACVSCLFLTSCLCGNGSVGCQGNLDVATQLLIEACDLFPDDFSLLQTLGTLQVRCAFALGCAR